MKKKFAEFKEVIKIAKLEMNKNLLSWRLIFPFTATVTFLVWFAVDKKGIPLPWLFFAGFGMGWMYARYLFEYLFGHYFDGRKKGYEEGFKDAEELFREQMPDLIASKMEEKIKQYPMMGKARVEVVKPRRIES